MKQILIIFIVHWTITIQTPESCCHEPNYHVDPYTMQRVSDGCETWAVMCYGTPIIDHLEKTFEDRTQAQKFIDDAPKNEGLGDWQIEERP